MDSTPPHPAASWWHWRDDGRIQCDLCPRGCVLRRGQRGFCFVRQASAQGLLQATWGRSSGFCVDPVEKKPLFHFLPGSAILSFGTAGCNLGCRFCQNHELSRARDQDRLQERATPDQIAETAVAAGCESVAFTYNDPVVFAEYALDTARACRDRGVRAVAVTAGYIQSPAREAFFAGMDAANIDLKAFSEGFYRELCDARLGPVLETIRHAVRDTPCHVELTTLLIPGRNDADADLQAMSDWIVEALGPDVPLHFSAFHPAHRVLDVSRTPLATLRRARAIARGAGVRFVYTGNVSDPEGESTWCPGCGALLVERGDYRLGAWGLEQGRCGACGVEIPGVFGEAPDTWGARRRPVRPA